MSRIILIHGFATGIRYSVFRRAHGADAGFSAFREDVEVGNAKAFRWDVQDEASFFQSLNPFYSWNIYRRERVIAKHPETFKRLHAFLSAEQPEIILCHSMGSFLFSEYLKTEVLPVSVKRIVFNQADLPTNGIDVSADVLARVGSGKLSISNIYCFWDPTLWLAVVLSGSLKAGLLGMSSTLIQNTFWPLWRPINLHTSAIRSKRFRDFVVRFV